MFKNQIHFVPILYGTNINRFFINQNLYGMNLNKVNIGRKFRLLFIGIFVFKAFDSFEILVVVGNMCN